MYLLLGLSITCLDIKGFYYLVNIQTSTRSIIGLMVFYKADVRINK